MKRSRKIVKKYYADMGSIRIFSKDFACFFSNGIGDGAYKLTISNKDFEETKNIKFVGHFEVRNEAFLSRYDCEDEPIYAFKKGRYPVYCDNNGNMFIGFWEE